MDSRTDGDVTLSSVDGKIKCRTCRFAAQNLERSGKVLVYGYKSAYCAVYDRDTHGKPNGVLFRGEECEYYQRLEKRLSSE